MRLRSSILLLVLLAIVIALVPPAASAQRLTFIRDTEIENTLRAYATPLFQAAGLDPAAVRIYVVNDRQINAFVAGGQNLFINTGLLTQSQTANQVVGVIAHEVGHIEGGHLARVHDALRRTTAEQILAIVLGVAAAAAGRPDVAGAVVAGGQNVALRNLLQYSRTQEGAADAAAMRYLDATQQSAGGLLSFFEILAKQDMLTPNRQDPYLRSHPLTTDRIQALQAFVARSPNSAAPEPAEFTRMHGRMLAKLHAFLDDPQVVRRRYPDSATTLEARYARAILAHRTNQPTESMALIDGLIAEHPSDPYFHDLKGQILLETGQPAQALLSYRRAVELLPDAPLLRVDLARTELALNDPALTRSAVQNLRQALLAEPERPFYWRQLAIALGRDGQLGESALAQSEEALLLGNLAEASYHAGKAERLLPADAPGRLRAQDILQVIAQKKKDQG